VTHDPIDAMLTQITGAGLGFTRGTDAFRGPPRGPSSKFPVQSLFINLEPGAPPQRFMGQSEEIRNPIVSVRIRWTKFAPGHSKSKDVQNSLQADSISGYLDLSALGSAPTYLGEDNEGHHHWLIQFSLVFEETA